MLEAGGIERFATLAFESLAVEVGGPVRTYGGGRFPLRGPGSRRHSRGDGAASTRVLRVHGFSLSFLKRGEANDSGDRGGDRAERGRSGDGARGRARGGAEAVDDVQQLRLRARRRLIGAAVLVGVAVIVFPLLAETPPRSIPVDLPIDIPRKDGATPGGIPAPTAPTSRGQTAGKEEAAGASPSPQVKSTPPTRRFRHAGSASRPSGRSSGPGHAAHAHGHQARRARDDRRARPPGARRAQA